MKYIKILQLGSLTFTSCKCVVIGGGGCRSYYDGDGSERIIIFCQFVAKTSERLYAANSQQGMLL